jgi:multidrug resistance efflux pump
VADSFHRSMRLLQADRGIAGRMGLGAVIVLAAAWACWLVLGRVGVFAVSSTARVEVDQASHPVESPVEGRVARTSMELDRGVERGDVLVELDCESEKLALAKDRAYLDAVEPQLRAVKAELELRRQASGSEGQASKARVEEASAKIDEAEAAAKLAEDQRRRIAQLYGSGAVPEAELRRMEAEADQKRAAANAASHVPDRVIWEQRTSDTERRASIEQLQRSVAFLDGETRTTEARLALLEHEIARRRIVAPIAGRLGEVSLLRVGQFVKAGDRLATVVPAGRLHAVASFDPAVALGRVHQGSKARLRLAGFPWTQFGTLPAEVESVGSEVRGGSVRVELRLLSAPGSKVPLQHGLPGTAEIEVERISPAALLIRLAGKLVEDEPAPGRSPSRSSPSPQERPVEPANPTGEAP